MFVYMIDFFSHAFRHLNHSVQVIHSEIYLYILYKNLILDLFYLLNYLFEKNKF